MKKSHITIGLFAVFLCAACKKESTSAPSADQADPFIRQDNPDNTADHLIYEFYKETGIPLLYNDTISREPVVLLNLGYHLTVIDTLVHYTLLTSGADVIRGVGFVKDQLMPYLGEQLKPYSFFLVDSLYTNLSLTNPTKVMLSTYSGLNSMAIGNFRQMDEWNAAQLVAYRAAIFKSLLTTYFSANMQQLAGFAAVSANYYGKTAVGVSTTGDYIPYKPKEEYGFLGVNAESPTSYQVGTQPEDLDRYLTAVLTTTETDFTTLYGSYPLIMKKYEALRQAFAAIHFTLPE